MLGYQSIFLVPVPLIVTSATIFVAKSVSDRQFRTWMLGPKVTHCLLASIFPVTTPRPKQEVHSKICLLIFIHLLQWQEDDLLENEIMSRMKIAGPELVFAFLLHSVNLLFGIVVFTILMETSPEYASTMMKVEKASGFSMSTMIYLICPISLLLSGLVKISFHATSERWKEIGSSEKWSWKQCVPKSRSEIALKKVTFQEPGAAPSNVTAEFNEILETINYKKK